MLSLARLTLALALLATCGPAPDAPSPSQLRSELVQPPMPLRVPQQLAPPNCATLRQEAAQLSSACAREMLRGCVDWDDCTSCSAHDRKKREIAEAKCQ
jgi:hypothetical protein